MRNGPLLSVLAGTIGWVDYGRTGLVVMDDGLEEVWDTAAPALDCADFEAAELAWTASDPFATEAEPTDGAGLSFHHPDADTGGWEAVSLPDTSIPVDMDRAYRGTLELSAEPPGAFVDLQSDDGLWLWVNGVAVGHWGGDWQEEGCVNERAKCLHTVEIDPVEVTDLLVPGRNVIAARVSNPVENAWFELVPSCVE